MIWDIQVARVLHILAAIIWIGNGFALALWWGPTSMMAGEAGQRFWEVLVKRSLFVKGMAATSLITVLAGGYLYVRLDYHQLIGEWAGATVLTVGAAAGLAAAALTPLHMGLTRRIWQVRDAAGDRPTQAQQDEIAALGRAFMRLDALTLLLALIAVVAMATARYWP